MFLVLPSSFQQCFGYHLAGRHGPDRADGIKLKESGKTTTGCWEIKEACKWFAGQYRYQPSQELLAYKLFWCPEDWVFCSFNVDMTHSIITQQHFSISSMVPAYVPDVGAHISAFADPYTVTLVL